MGRKEVYELSQDDEYLKKLVNSLSEDDMRCTLMAMQAVHEATNHEAIGYQVVRLIIGVYGLYVYIVLRVHTFHTPFLVHLPQSNTVYGASQRKHRALACRIYLEASFESQSDRLPTKRINTEHNYFSPTSRAKPAIMIPSTVKPT